MRTTARARDAILKWLGSDKNRFTELMRPHFDALYIAAQRMTTSAADAEDLVQDVCLKAHMHIDELEKVEFQRAWLLKILYHRFIDIQRTRDRSPVDMAETGSESNDPDLIGRDESRPDNLVEREKRLETIFRAMEILGHEASSLVALHDIEGFSLEELRQVTGLPEGTLKSRLYRTRSRLGRLLSNRDIHKPVLTVVGGKK
jgi:RNA polymerase sigma-70 factor (ECF subfamily)